MSEHIGAFRAWCQKVLPLVYDDSLSYYELLCKVTNKLNEVINNENGLNDGFEELKADFEKLKVELNQVIEEEAEKVIDKYVSEHNLISTVNGIGADVGTGNITLKAADVGAIPNVNGSVKNNNLEDGGVTGVKIGNGAVTEGKIASGAVTGGKIATGAVSEGKIADGAVTNAKLGANAVSEGKIASSAVTGGKIATGAVSEGKIADGAVSESKIEDGAVSELKIGDGAVSEEKIKEDAVTTSKIKNYAVTEGKLDDRAVTNGKLAIDSVRPENIVNGSLTEPKFADNSISNRIIADGAVTPSKISGGSENSGKLLKVGADGIPFWGSGEGQVTAGVESVNGKDGAVTLTASDVRAISNTDDSVKFGNLKKYLRPDINNLKTIYPGASKDNPVAIHWYDFPTAIFDGDNLIYGESAKVIWETNGFAGLNVNLNNIFGNGNNNVLATINNRTIFTKVNDNLLADNISGSKLLNHSIPIFKIAGDRNNIGDAIILDGNGNPNYSSAYVKSINGITGEVTLQASDIGALSSGDEEVKSSNIANQAITNEKIADYSVDSNKIADASITTGKIVNLSVTGDKLSASSVTATKIANNAVTGAKIASGAITEDKISDDAITTNKLEDMCVTLAKIDNLGSENAGKVLSVQSNGDVGLVELKQDSGVKKVTLTNAQLNLVANVAYDGVNLTVSVRKEDYTAFTLDTQTITFDGVIPDDMCAIIKARVKTNEYVDCPAHGYWGSNVAGTQNTINTATQRGTFRFTNAPEGVKLTLVGGSTSYVIVSTGCFIHC